MEIIDAVVKIWNDDGIITSSNVIKSFKTTGISINLDGSEQHMVKKMMKYETKLYSQMMLF